MGMCLKECRRRRTTASGSGDRVVVIDTRERAPRDFYISKKDAEKSGITRGCGGCSSWYRGLARQPHSEACRERFRELMKDEAKVKRQAAKRKEFEDKELDWKKRKEDMSGLLRWKERGLRKSGMRN